MSALDRIAAGRRWLDRHLPLPHLHALFVALVLATPLERLYRIFYIALLLVPFLVLATRDEWRRLAGSWVLRFCLAYLAMIWLTLFWTPDMPAGEFLRVGRHLLANLGFVALTAWLVGRDDHHVLRLCRWIAWAALVTAAVSLGLFYAHHPWGERLAAWLWPNTNTAGAVFGLACVAALAGPAMAERPGRRWLHLAVAMLLGLCLVLTGSRAAFAGAMASGIVCLLLRRAWQPVAGLAVAALAGAGLMLAGGIAPGDWLARADSGRMELWSHFWQLSWQRPWGGWGLRQDLVFAAGNGLTTDDPHDMVLETFMRTGLPGTLAWIGAALAALIAGYRHWRASGGLAPLALVLYLVAQGIFESALPINNADWFWIHLWIPLGIAAGVALRSPDLLRADRGA